MDKKAEASRGKTYLHMATPCAFMDWQTPSCKGFDL